MKSVHPRLSRLDLAARDRPAPGALHVITVLRAADDRDHRPAGVYTYPGGTSVDLVHDGPEPDPAALRALTDRLVPWGLIISCDPT